MKDIVIIPSYWRVEFLYLCLEHLSKCPESKDLEFWIFQDQKFGDAERFKDDAPELDWVIKHWQQHLNLRAFVRPVNSFYGNSYNVLRAYDKAYKTDARYVYLIEDDIFVTPDFFKWHKEAMGNSEFYSCSIAGKTEECRYSIYRSLGVCWRRTELEKIVKHAIPEYYTSMASMANYINNNFTSLYDPTEFIEQDGLISRVIEQENMDVIWAPEFKAYHIGVYGYHRGIGTKHMPVGTLPQRIEFFRKRLSDSVWIHRVADFQKDIQPFPIKENKI